MCFCTFTRFQVLCIVGKQKKKIVDDATKKKEKAELWAQWKVEALQQKWLRKTRVNTWFHYACSLPPQHLLRTTKHSLGVRRCF